MLYVSALTECMMLRDNFNQYGSTSYQSQPAHELFSTMFPKFLNIHTLYSTNVFISFNGNNEFISELAENYYYSAATHLSSFK